MSYPVSLSNRSMLPRLAAPDRLIIALFLAAVAHAVLILGIRFDLESPKTKKFSKSLDITLITRPSKEAPKQADFLAQDNQIGGGDNKKKAQLPPPKDPQPAERIVNKRARPSKTKVAKTASPLNSTPV